MLPGYGGGQITTHIPRTQERYVRRVDSPRWQRWVPTLPAYGLWRVTWPVTDSNGTPA